MAKVIIRCILAAVCAASLWGCLPRVTAPHIPPQLPGGAELEQQREMLALSFVAYTGELLTGPDSEVETRLVRCLRSELDVQPLTTGKWDLVWGPAVYKFADATLDDNMMYVVRDASDPAHLVVAVRGTNGKAILDWLKEDLEVFHTEKWAYGEPPPHLDPRISRGTHTGLDILSPHIA